MGGRTDEDNQPPFGELIKTEIAATLGKADDPRFSRFWDELQEFGARNARLVKQTPNGFPMAPFDATLSERMEWLTTHFVNPALKIEDALSEANRPHFTHWESEGDIVPEFWQTLGEHIKQAREKVEQDIQGLRFDVEFDSQHTSDIRHQIVFETIEMALRHFPEIQPSRGTWDKETKTMAGAFPDYIRIVFKEITGSEEKLNGPIKKLIPIARK